MIARRDGFAYEYVVVDLNTQFDFCSIGGRHPVSNLMELIPSLRRIIAWTKRNAVPVVSSITAHRKSEIAPGDTDACCIDGSVGQGKVGFTLLDKRKQVEIDNTLNLRLDLFRDYQQVLFRKRTDDLLANPKADRFLTQVPTREFIVIGNSVECSVKALTLGLVARGKAVTVIVDGCGFWDQGAADLTFRQLVAKGAMLATVDEVVCRKLANRKRYSPRMAEAFMQNEYLPRSQSNSVAKSDAAGRNGNGLVRNPARNGRSSK